MTISDERLREKVQEFAEKMVDYGCASNVRTIDSELNALLAEAVAQEREACANECMLCASRQGEKHNQKIRDQTRRDLAAAIRSRSQPQTKEDDHA